MPNEITPDAVASAVTSLLSEPSFRQAAERIQEEIMAMPPPEEVAHRLAAMV